MGILSCNHPITLAPPSPRMCCPACRTGKWMADTTVPCLPKEYRYGDGLYDTCSYINSPTIVGPNWGWLGGNFTYGSVDFDNVTIEYSNFSAVTDEIIARSVFAIVLIGSNMRPRKCTRRAITQRRCPSPLFCPSALLQGLRY